MEEFVIVFFQLLSSFLFYIPFKIFFAIKGRIPLEVKKIQKGSLLIANHQTKLDPWIIMDHLGPTSFTKILPIYFPVTNEYMSHPFWGNFLKLFGCYDVGATKREKMIALFYARELLRQGKTVFMFPEGKIIRKGNLTADFKKGIDFLVPYAKSVVCARIKDFNNIKFPSFRSVCSITFTQMQNFKDQNINAEELKMSFNK